jgi:hypothetical protein
MNCTQSFCSEHYRLVNTATENCKGEAEVKLAIGV